MCYTIFLNTYLPLKGLFWLRLRYIPIDWDFISKALPAALIEEYLVTVFNSKSVTSISTDAGWSK